MKQNHLKRRDFLKCAGALATLPLSTVELAFADASRNFTFAYISDAHIQHIQGTKFVHNWDRGLIRAVAETNLLYPRPDFVVFGGDLVEYTYGGGMGYTCSRDAYYFDTVSGAWSRLPDLNRCLYGSQGDGDGDTFYLVSGRTNEGGWHMATDVEYLESCPACTRVGWLEGYVYDYDNVSWPCRDATVHIEPGNRNVPVDATGYYTVALVPFGYDVVEDSYLVCCRFKVDIVFKSDERHYDSKFASELSSQRADSVEYLAFFPRINE